MRELVVATFLVLAGCGGGSEEGAGPDAPSGACTQGAKECRADGLYACTNGTFRLEEACTQCEAAPTPHCLDACGAAGAVTTCDGDSIRRCSDDARFSCAPGTCVLSGNEAVCVTRAVDDECLFEGPQGDFTILCGDGTSVSPDHICDQRTGSCVPAQFDCSSLTGIATGQVQCDATSGNLYTSCDGGQPSGLACAAGTKCASNGGLDCFTAPTNGVACGGPAVCVPNMICTQTAASAPSCVTPAGSLACSSTDVLAVCTDQNTAFACVEGKFWSWDNLTTWGGACTSNHVSLGAGGTCIPGLADCKAGLACDRSVYDIAGTCRTPLTSAPAECTLTGSISTGLSCVHQWQSCRNGKQYGVSCQRQSIAGQTFTLCECYVNGVNTTDYVGAEVCGATTLEALDAAAAQGCGWDVETVDVSRAL